METTAQEHDWRRTDKLTRDKGKAEIVYTQKADEGSGNTWDGQT